MPEQYASYEQVPSYRQSGVASVLVLAGFFCFPPLLWAVCVLCLTGDIYYNRVGKDGYLKTWSWGNKVAAVIILGIQSAAIALRLSGVLSPQGEEVVRPFGGFGP